MAAVDGRADGKRVSGAGARGAQRMRTQIELPNDVAAELAGSQDAVLRALEAHLDCKVFLRGNLLTLDGEEAETHAGERVVRELSELIARGHEIGAGHDRRGDRRARRARVAGAGARGRRLAPPRPAGRARRPSTRSATWTRSARTRSPSASARRARARRSSRWRWRPPRCSRHEVNRIILTRPAVEAGERLGFLPGRPDGEGRSLPAAAVRRAARHARPREGLQLHRARRDRDRAAGVHARAHAQRLVRDPRRGAEHDARADEDVPHAARLRLEDGRDRRHHPGRPAARAAVRA